MHDNGTFGSIDSLSNPNMFYDAKEDQKCKEIFIT